MTFYKRKKKLTNINNNKIKLQHILKVVSCALHTTTVSLYLHIVFLQCTWALFDISTWLLCVIRRIFAINIDVKYCWKDSIFFGGKDSPIFIYSQQIIKGKFSTACFFPTNHKRKVFNRIFCSKTSYHVSYWMELHQI